MQDFFHPYISRFKWSSLHGWPCYAAPSLGLAVAMQFEHRRKGSGGSLRRLFEFTFFFFLQNLSSFVSGYTTFLACIPMTRSILIVCYRDMDQTATKNHLEGILDWACFLDLRKMLPLIEPTRPSSLGVNAGRGSRWCSTAPFKSCNVPKGNAT